METIIFGTKWQDGMAKIQRPIADGHATVNYCANSLLLCLTPQVQAIFEENVDGSVTLHKSGIKCKASFFFSFSFFFFWGGGERQRNEILPSPNNKVRIGLDIPHGEHCRVNKPPWRITQIVPPSSRSTGLYGVRSLGIADLVRVCGLQVGLVIVKVRNLPKTP